MHELNAHCPLPIGHCLWLPDALGQRNRCNDGSRCAQCLGDQDCSAREVRIFGVLCLLFKEERLSYFVFEFLFKEVRIFLYFVFCICNSYWRKVSFFFVFCISYSRRWGFLIFCICISFSRMWGFVCFWKCICYPRLAWESISEYCTIIKFKLV